MWLRYMQYAPRRFLFVMLAEVRAPYNNAYAYYNNNF